MAMKPNVRVEVYPNATFGIAKPRVLIKEDNGATLLDVLMGFEPDEAEALAAELTRAVTEARAIKDALH